MKEMESIQENGIFKVPATISETVYQFLKKAILAGEFKPGQRLQEKEVAGIYHMSTTPVREAFRRLSAEQFLSIDARRGVRITSITGEDLRDFFRVVTLLDIYAIKSSLPFIGPETLEKLKQMTTELGNLSRQKTYFDYVKKNVEIHLLLWDECRNNFLRQMLQGLNEKFIFYSHRFFEFVQNPESYLKKSFQEHLDLVKAVEKKDAVMIEQVLASHWGGEFLTGHY